MLFFLSYVIPSFNVFLFLGHYPHWLFWMPILYAFGIYSVLDIVGEKIQFNPKPFKSKFLCDLILNGVTPLLFLNLFYLYQWIANHGWDWLPIIDVGMLMGAVGFSTAHELFHRKSKIERALGIAIMIPLNYAHFRIEHVYGHHKNVATWNDPASARFGEPLFPFIWRSVTTGYVHAWKIDRERSDKQMIVFAVLQFVWMFAVVVHFGFIVLAAHLVQGLIAIVFLESVNYIEHYGLQRKTMAPGRFEPISDHHSWDSSGPATNATLWNLAKHANHHASASTPYNELEIMPGSRKLPFGYPVMILLALVPVIWRRVMK